jgi:hypothetical protein
MTLTLTLRASLLATRLPVPKKLVDFQELCGLPLPVQRYFRLVLTEGQPIVTGVRLRHEGTFNMGKRAARWKPFSSDQLVVVHPPGFDWDARIVLWPCVSVHVHDAYVAGTGILHAALPGGLTVADTRGGSRIAEGELMRFLAEAAWYPTALLPSEGVTWEAVGIDSACATLTDGQVSVSLTFHFKKNGAIDVVHADKRGRTVGKDIVDTPWEGRFWHYKSCHGMVLPYEGEASWMPPEGPQPYWRGTVDTIAHEFAA